MKLIRAMQLIGFLSLFSLIPVLTANATVESESGQSYHFLEAMRKIIHEENGLDVEAGKEEKEKYGVEVETKEERKQRENIRNALRLIDGDDVSITREIKVRLIGVDMPEYEDYDENRNYEKMASEVKGWVRSFVDDPEAALHSYMGMNTRMVSNDSDGQRFVHYYLYIPSMLLADLRHNELMRYEEWMEGKSGPVSGGLTDAQQADAAKTRLKYADQAVDDPRKHVKEYVISEAKWFHDNGALQREEIYRDGRLLIRREFDPYGNLTDEVFFTSNGEAKTIKDIKDHES